MPDPTSDKGELRRFSWDLLSDAGVVRFPGAHGRIPNFEGAKEAAAQLAATPEWEAARALKSNPDAPQRTVRHAALRAGKTVYVAVPRLRGEAPFLRLDPARLDPGQLWKASSIKGSAELGRPVKVRDVPRLDLVVTGCVAATAEGARLGKGGGYADLEFGLLHEAGRVDAETVIATTVHAEQLLEPGAVPLDAHDLPLDLIATPERTIRCATRFARPPGVLWDHLPAETIAAIPALEQARRGRSGGGRGAARRRGARRRS